MSFSALPQELLHLFVKAVRLDRRGRVTIPGLVADARNRRVNRAFRAASADLPAPGFDAIVHCTRIGERRLPTVVMRNHRRSYATGGVYYRSLTMPYSGLLLARQPATGRLHALLVNDEHASFPGHMHTCDWDLNRYSLATNEQPRPPTYNPLHPLSVIWPHRKRLVQHVLDIRELVLNVCGNNADYENNLALFDQVVGAPMRDPGGRVHTQRRICIELPKYLSDLGPHQEVEGVASRYNRSLPPVDDWGGYNPDPYPSPTGWQRSVARFQLHPVRFTTAGSRPHLTPEVSMVVRTIVDPLPKSRSVFGRHQDEPTPAPGSLESAVPSLSAMCGFFDEPAHAECCGWYAHIDNHGLTPAALKELVGLPRRNDAEAYRRALARLALDRAERKRAAQTALVVHTGAASAPRARPREAAAHAGILVGEAIAEDNDTYATGELKRKRQERDEPADVQAADARYAADNEIEDPLYDSDPEYEEDDRRTRTQKLAERRAEALAEMQALEEARKQPSDDEDDL